MENITTYEMAISKMLEKAGNKFITQFIDEDVNFDGLYSNEEQDYIYFVLFYRFTSNTTAYELTGVIRDGEIYFQNAYNWYETKTEKIWSSPSKKGVQI